MNPILIGIVVLGIFATTLIGILIKKVIVHRGLFQALQLRLLSVSVPRAKPDEKEAVTDEVRISAQLLHILAGLKIPVSLEVAVHNVGEEIHFYIAVPATARDFVVKQIHSFWPNANVAPADDYTIFTSGGAVDAVYVKQKESYVLPIRTYADANIDTFAPILGHFGQLESLGEGLAIQVMLRPAPSSVKKVITSFIDNIRKPKEEKKNGHTIRTPAELTTTDTEKIKAAEQKLSKPMFSVNYRIVASAATLHRAKSIVDGVIETYSQFSAPLRNEFRFVRPRDPKNIAYQYIFRKFNPEQSMMLGLDELVSVFHFPTSSTTVPQIQWAKAREAEPPLNLPKEGVLLGTASFRGDRREVRLADDDRRRHLYIIGQTGTGKSNLLINMAENDIHRGKGVCVIDPHGDLVDAILGLVPPERANDTVVFDPGDILFPLGLNMLEYSPERPEEKTFIVNEMQSIFNRLFSQETMGPMFEQYMRNALLLLMDDPNEHATLMEVPRVFTDKEFRARLLQKARNPAVVDFWQNEAVKAGGEASLNNITPYVTSKFNNFVANDYIRPIIGQPRSALRFREAMDEGKILLVNLSKGRIGDINANLLGMIIVGKLLMAALSRVDIQQEKRRDFHLYIDEFHNFTTDSIATILSEARKYRLNLVMAHQFIAQLPEKIRDAVFGNVGSLVSFRIGADDAEYLEKQFLPVFAKDDLINIDNFNAYAKLLIGGQVSNPFNIKTLPAPVGDERERERIYNLSRERHAGNREKVEMDILARLRGSEAPAPPPQT